MSAKKRANGEGSIRKRYEGCWEGRYTAGYDILTGKRIQKGVFAKTKKECAAKLAKAIQENTGPYYQRGKGYDDVTLGHWMHLWFEAYVDAARKRPDEFQKRLKSFIDKTRQNKIIRGFGGIEKYY